MLRASDVRVGDTVKVVPFGLLADVKYNENGVISGIYLVSEDGTEQRKLSSLTASRVQKKNVVPSRISNARKCSVQGVFTFDHVGVNDVVAKGKQQAFLEELENGNLDDVEFRAYRIVESNAAYGVYNQTTSMEMLGFKCCTGFVVPANVTDKVIKSTPCMLKYPFVSGYAVYRTGNDYRYVPESFFYERVKSVSRTTNYAGYIVANVFFESGHVVNVPYPDVVNFNVQKGSYVIVDEGKIAFCSDKCNGSKRVEREFRCEFCGSTISSPFTGYVKCSYQNCTSNLYPVVEHMLSVLDLEPMPYSLYLESVKSGKVMCLTDVFNVELYSECQVSCTAATALKAVCPVGVVRDADFFGKLYEGSKSLEAFNHYIENPSEVAQDFSQVLDARDCKSFEAWISDPENLLTAKTILNDVSQVSIKSAVVELDVPQLFRNKTVFLEGKFKHGTYSEVASILRSYGAEIASKFDNRCSCVLLGDFVRDPESLPVVNVALSYNVPIYQESDFFASYGIDEDIKRAAN